MSSIQQVPVEILLDVFQANDPADAEALQLTCHRFRATILQNVDTLPARLVCDLVCARGRVWLFPTTYRRVEISNNERVTWRSGDPIAVADWSPEELRDMYHMCGRKTAIRTVDVPVDTHDSPDEPLMHLIEHFPSVKRAVRLDMHYYDSVLPTDAALDHFERLETIVMDTCTCWEGEFFWSDLCAVKAFRRVSNFITRDDDRRYLDEADAGALFDFITDCSLIPAGKTRVVKLGRPFTDDSFKALKRRFYDNIASIGGQVCAVIFDDYADKHHLTNMTSGRQKKTLAKKLLRAAYRVPAVNHA